MHHSQINIDRQTKMVNNEKITLTKIDENFGEISKERKINDPNAITSKNDCLNGL